MSAPGFSCLLSIPEWAQNVTPWNCSRDSQRKDSCQDPQDERTHFSRRCFSFPFQFLFLSFPSPFFSYSPLPIPSLPPPFLLPSFPFSCPFLIFRDVRLQVQQVVKRQKAKNSLLSCWAVPSWAGKLSCWRRDLATEWTVYKGTILQGCSRQDPLWGCEVAGKNTYKWPLTVFLSHDGYLYSQGPKAQRDCPGPLISAAQSAKSEDKESRAGGK